MAVYITNSDLESDNSNKIFEDGQYVGKDSADHEAVVIGDTVGDPFKDTAGTAIIPLIKVMNLVALLIAPAVVAMSIGDVNHTVRIVIAVVAAVIAVSAIVVSRIYAARVDASSRLEREALKAAKKAQK